MNAIRKWAVIGLGLGLAGMATAADLKVGVVNMPKIFEGYFKTKQAQATMKETTSNLEKSQKSLLDDHQKAGEEYTKILETAKDPAISKDEQEKRKRDAERKLTELQNMERSIQQFNSTSQKTLMEQRNRLMENVLKDIQDAVKEKGKAGGYNLVIDSAAQSPAGALIFLHADLPDDLSDAVLVSLNKDAPSDLLAPSTASPTPKDDKK